MSDAFFHQTPIAGIGHKSDLQYCIASLRQEGDHQPTTIFQKRQADLHDFGQMELQFYKRYTPYTFKLVKKQLDLQSFSATMQVVYCN